MIGISITKFKSEMREPAPGWRKYPLIKVVSETEETCDIYGFTSSEETAHASSLAPPPREGKY